MDMSKTMAELFLEEQAWTPEPSWSATLQRIMESGTQGSEQPFRFKPFEAHVDEMLGRFIRSNQIREKYIQRFGYAILTAGTVSQILQHLSGPFIEVGAGLAYWSHELRRAGADTVATDIHTGSRSLLPEWECPYESVIEMDAVEAVRRYPAHTLLMVWPSYDENWATEALQAYGGTHIVYVGEGPGGCTASDSFHELLASEWKPVEFIDIPRFYSIFDQLEIWAR